MLSYLKAVKPLVTEEVYQQGLKSYLEGKVLKETDLLLDHWKQFEVQSNHRHISCYLVKIPLLHLNLDSSKWTQATEALEQVCSCTCPYFEEIGICKHLVAVCAYLDKKFTKLEITDSNSSQAQTQIWENIFTAALTRKQNWWLFSLQKFLENNLSDKQKNHWLYDMTTELATQIPVQNLVLVTQDYLQNQSANYKFTGQKPTRPGQANCLIYWDFLESFEQKLRLSLKSYDLQKRVASLLWDLLELKSEYWLEFVCLWVKHLELKPQTDFWLKLFLHREDYFLQTQTKYIQETFQNLPVEIKSQILTLLQKDYCTNFKLHLTFGLYAQYLDWLENKWHLLDADSLLDLVPVWSDRLDELEQKIYSHMSTWSKFLPTGDYEDFLKVLSKWHTRLGLTETLDKFILETKEEHKKKTKLLAELDKLREK